MAMCLAPVLCTLETVNLELLAAQPPSRFVLRPGAPAPRRPGGRRAFGAACALGAFAFAFAIPGLTSSRAAPSSSPCGTSPCRPG
ncbi:predicted protein [Streptomyces viridochromogenes DSM 40736]|uniref:Predicted protein n=1 Tax=Streptomyces viridochromogenes (strain DSM 40736 / JCM 4977 / BCRC 1201 / Tue 494) TaxID=591159 RepID=D9X8W2_STRVT|nr:hypothetical protein [Streptomyces viridochromogenes]EFL36366.1 predicted protein [Streptomyces viridochromogenes DSM 40736]